MNCFSFALATMLISVCTRAAAPSTDCASIAIRTDAVYDTWGSVHPELEVDGSPRHVWILRIPGASQAVQADTALDDFSPPTTLRRSDFLGWQEGELGWLPVPTEFKHDREDGTIEVRPGTVKFRVFVSLDAKPWKRGTICRVTSQPFEVKGGMVMRRFE